MKCGRLYVWPWEVSAACIQDTLETSLCAHHLFPTDDGPEYRQPIPLAGGFMSPIRPTLKRNGLAGVILAGGRSRRMGGGFKALAPLGGKPLIRHVIDRLLPQVRSLVLSVEKHVLELDVFDLPQVEDPSPGSRGPLGGLLSALANMEMGCDWMVLAPCDAPLLPLELADRLLNCALDDNRAGCVVRYDSEIQPTFSLWNRRLLPRLQEAVLEEGMAGFKQFLQDTPVATLDWEFSDLSPFFNVNDPDTLDEAARLLDRISAPI